jgi:hypothetical protein
VVILKVFEGAETPQEYLNGWGIHIARFQDQIRGPEFQLGGKSIGAEEDRETFKRLD